MQQFSRLSISLALQHVNQWQHHLWRSSCPICHHAVQFQIRLCHTRIIVEHFGAADTILNELPGSHHAQCGFSGGILNLLRFVNRRRGISHQLMAPAPLETLMRPDDAVDLCTNCTKACPMAAKPMALCVEGVAHLLARSTLNGSHGCVIYHMLTLEPSCSPLRRLESS